MSIGLLGRKAGMTQIFAADGTLVPVSVVIVEPNTVTAIRTAEHDGYTAVQLGTGTARRLSKPRRRSNPWASSGCRCFSQIIKES